MQLQREPELKATIPLHNLKNTLAAASRDLSETTPTRKITQAQKQRLNLVRMRFAQHEFSRQAPDDLVSFWIQHYFMSQHFEIVPLSPAMEVAFFIFANPKLTKIKAKADESLIALGHASNRTMLNLLLKNLAEATENYQVVN